MWELSPLFFNNQLTDRIESRKKVYCFILKKAKESDSASNNRLSKTDNGIDCILINNLIGPKEGTSGPPLQLVTSIKKLLQGTTNETEIGQYLVKPFIDQNLNSTINMNP